MRLDRRHFVTLSTGLLAAGVAGCASAETVPAEGTRTAGSDDSPDPTTTSTSSPSSRQSDEQAPPRARDVVTGLTSPWALVPLKDGTLLVPERDTAKIKRVEGTETIELTTLGAVQPGGEGGLLGLVASPDEATVYAYFTAADDNRIVAMSWDGVTLGEPSDVLTGIPKGTRHNGGRMVFGPDGHLYVGTGEVGDEQLAQDTASLAGKILRITGEGKPVDDNPFDNEVYSLGHRNVQGLAFDEQDRLWASEFGDQTWDELNLIIKGANYGWPDVEGSGEQAGMTNPKVVWPTSEASPSGLAYWKGSLYMAALRGQRLWEIPLDGTDTGTPVAHFSQKYGRLRSVTVAADQGSLLITTSNTDGRLDPKPGDDRILEITR